MRIIVDASRALYLNPTGIELYCREIIWALLTLPESIRHRWTLLSPQRPHSDHILSDLPPQARWKIIPGNRFWTLYHTSRYFWSDQEIKNACLFVPGHVLPLVTPQKTVITIHDFAFRYFPSAYGYLKARLLNHELRRSARKASQVIVPSQTTASDLARFYQIPSTKIHVVPHGVDHLQTTRVSNPTLHQEIDRRQPYALMIGRLESRKNLIRALKAFALAKVNNLQLVVIGNPGHGWPNIKKTLEGLPSSVTARIHLLGYQNLSELLAWLRGAELLFFPSLYEGFGIPALEAMVCGVPVIASQTSSLTEVVGSAGRLIDPTNINQMSQALTELHHDSAVRTSLSEAGLKRAQQFTWHEAAQKTLHVLEEA